MGQAESFTYDAAGRLTEDGRGSYTYNGANLQATASMTAGALQTYRFDADDRRVLKITGTETSRTYIVNGLSEFSTEGGALTWTVDYVSAGGRLLAAVRPNPALTRYTLTVSKGGSGTGRVTALPAGLDCGPTCTARYVDGAPITLTALPDAGAQFGGWSGDCTAVPNHPTMATVTIDGANASCTATFSPLQALTVTLSASGAGTVSSAPQGLTCQGTSCSGYYEADTEVTLAATAASGWRFAGWSGDADCADHVVTMSGARSCTATFVRQYTLTIIRAGEGADAGTVTSSPSGIDCGTTCSAPYDTGSSVELSAEAGSGYVLTGWTGTGCTLGIASMTEDRTCTATFDPAPCDPEQAAACRGTGGRWDDETCTCDMEWYDPLVLRLDGGPVRLTPQWAGVWFDVDGDGRRERVAWTRPGTGEAFLGLDLDDDGAIDTGAELFGTTVTRPSRQKPTAQENSFTLLAAYDRAEHGGNGDGAISAADAVYGRLRLWVDANHDGVSQPEELITLAAAGVARIELSYRTISRRDGQGNYYRYRGVVHLTSGGTVPIWDVFLSTYDPPGGGPAAEPSVSAPGTPVVAADGAPATPAVSRTAVAPEPAELGHGLSPDSRLDQAADSEPAASGGRSLPAGIGVAPNSESAAMQEAGSTEPDGSEVLAFSPAQPPPPPLLQVVEYYHLDAIGSVRVVTDETGQVIARHDFLPFGEELAPQNPPRDRKLFTGQERDFETQQDYFNARQMRPDLGRFITPDPITWLPVPFDSQALNAYVYVRNNPLSFVDPTGLVGETPQFTMTVDVVAPQPQPSALEMPGPITLTAEEVRSLIAAIGGNVSEMPITGREPAAPDNAARPQIAAPSNGGTPSAGQKSPTVLKRIERFVCKSSAGDRIWASIRFGAIKGAIVGGYAGFTSGEILGAGVGGFPGALLGSFVVGTLGTGAGAITGTEIAVGCSLFGAYEQPSR